MFFTFICTEGVVADLGTDIVGEVVLVSDHDPLDAMTLTDTLTTSEAGPVATPLHPNTPRQRTETERERKTRANDQTRLHPHDLTKTKRCQSHLLSRAKIKRRVVTVGRRHTLADC